VACITDQGTSGAFYVASAADTIIAYPTALVGSIGVILHSFDLSGLLGKIGVAVSPVKSSEKKDLTSIFRPHSPEERSILQKLVDDMHQRFIDVVDSGRPGLNREEVLKLADGSVVSGAEAAKLKLVDRTGYLKDAIAEAASRAKVEEPTIIRYTRRARSGANIYSQLAGPRPSAAEVNLRLDSWPFAAPKLLYLWQPGL
jgi:protease-4